MGLARALRRLSFGQSDRWISSFARPRGGVDSFPMIPEVFECPRCERQFVIDDVPDHGSEEVHCPQCSRFLGVRDIAFVLRTEVDELIERLSYEKDRLEKDEAIYGMTDCDAEMKYYGREVSRVIHVLRGALKELRVLREDFRVKN